MDSILLDEEKIKREIDSLPGWTYNNLSISKSFNFNSFIDAFAFMTKVALISESLNHHPDWRNVYSRVDIKLTTHDLGGVTSKDINLAKIINHSANNSK
tara:strand:- start:1037 stop:1333 length:297 start_codon:yes stop_codon:yes gene_type:complete